MNRVQVQLDDALHEQVRAIARRKRVSVSEVVRRLVRAGMRAGDEGEGGTARYRGAAALLELRRYAVDGPGDLGRRHDDYLAERDEP